MISKLGARRSNSFTNGANTPALLVGAADAVELALELALNLRTCVRMAGEFGRDMTFRARRLHLIQPRTIMMSSLRLKSRNMLNPELVSACIDCIDIAEADDGSCTFIAGMQRSRCFTAADPPSRTSACSYSSNRPDLNSSPSLQIEAPLKHHSPCRPSREPCAISAKSESRFVYSIDMLPLALHKLTLRQDSLVQLWVRKPLFRLSRHNEPF